MRKLCDCGKLATHRVRWNEWNDASEPVRSVRPSRCFACAVAECERATAQARSERSYEMRFSDLSRLVFKSDGPVPHEWVKLARQVCRRHGTTINPGGLVKAYQQGNTLYVEIYPPLEKTDSWKAEHVLYSLRYLMRRPVLFLAVPRDESPSPATLKESRERFSESRPASVIGSPRRTE